MEVSEGDRLRVAKDGYVAVVWVMRASLRPDENTFRRTVPRGTVLVVDREPLGEGRPELHVVPEDYKGMERVLVPDDVRRTRTYGGYTVICSVLDVGTALERL